MKKDEMKKDETRVSTILAGCLVMAIVTMAGCLGGTTYISGGSIDANVRGTVNTNANCQVVVYNNDDYILTTAPGSTLVNENEYRTSVDCQDVVQITPIKAMGNSTEMQFCAGRARMILSEKKGMPWSECPTDYDRANCPSDLKTAVEFQLAAPMLIQKEAAPLVPSGQAKVGLAGETIRFEETCGTTVYYRLTEVELGGTKSIAMGGQSQVIDLIPYFDLTYCPLDGTTEVAVWAQYPGDRGQAIAVGAEGTAELYRNNESFPLDRITLSGTSYAWFNKTLTCGADSFRVRVIAGFNGTMIADTIQGQTVFYAQHASENLKFVMRPAVV